MFLNPKQALWKALPGPVKKFYVQIKASLLEYLDINNSEKVFTRIYREGFWGRDDDGYCSGIGSVNELIVTNYVAAIVDEADKWDFGNKTFVDLGCGDFRVGSQLVPLCSNYVAVDVVKPLIENNKEKFVSEKVEFLHMDIIEEDLPKGDVCFIRQVLQHLSNQQIKKIVDKFDQYTWVYITEHLPPRLDKIVPNINKVPDGKIRLTYHSGVYLSEPPFNLSAQKIKTILEVPASGIEADDSSGVIRTLLYMPGGLK